MPFAIQSGSISRNEFNALISNPNNFGGGFDFLRFSPDGNLLISSNSLGQTKFWDVKTGKIIRQLDGGRGRMGLAGCQQFLAINPIDSTKVIYNSNLGVYKIDSQEKPISLSFPDENQRDDRDTLFAFARDTTNGCTSFSSDGQMIAVSSKGDLHIWQSATGDRLYRLPAQLTAIQPNNNYEYLAFSPNSQLLTTGKSDGIIQLWDMKNGKEISKTIAHNQQKIRFLGFSPNGATLVSIGSEGSIKLWEIK
jgi:WD40 repeat protein